MFYVAEKMTNYIKKVKRYAKKNPEQTALILYDTGVFGWLQANVGGINELHEITEGPLSWVPQSSIDTVKNLFTSLPYGWLFVSFGAAFLMKTLNRKAKKYLLWGLIALGLYFMWGYAKTNGWLS